MIFIGIIENKCSEQIRVVLEGFINKNNLDMEVDIKILTSKTVDLGLNDVFIANGDFEFPLDKLCNKKIFVVNGDNKKLWQRLQMVQGTIVTYGINSKSSITVSSVCSDYIEICIQRNMINLKGEIIEQQEFLVDIKEGENYNDILAAISAFIMIGGNISSVKK